MSSRAGGAVLGSPISHSLSPVLHRAAYDALGLTGWSYRAIECTTDELPATLQALDALGCAGASLTMPLKRAVMPMLARADADATTVGAANTVVFGAAEGEWVGANTDVAGIVAAVRRALASQPQGERAAILGAGATAASAIAAMAQLGFAGVDVFARRPGAAAALASLAESLTVGFTVHDFAEVAAAGTAPLVISTTPPGATAALADGLPAASAGRLQGRPGVLFDVIYSPWPTPLAAAWQGAGGQVVGGIELLVEQAALQVGLMTGRSAPVEVMRQAGHAALREGRAIG
jgi:shikimate dehydrogenase